MPASAFKDNKCKVVVPSETEMQEALEEKAASNHNHNETYYKKTEIDTKLNGKANASHAHADYKIKGDFAVLTGNISLSSGGGNASIGYPSGFTHDNCVPVAIGGGRNASTTYMEYVQIANTSIIGAYLNASNITITVYAPEKLGSSATVPFKIVLMKV